MKKIKNIFLASASPRRSEILEQVGASFVVLPSGVDEKITKTIPNEVVMELASQKAKDVFYTNDNEGLYIGADTVVAYNDNILGKPHDKQDAFHMLKRLQGNVHSVFTGVMLIIKNGDEYIEINFYQKTDVKMYNLEDEEIKQYIETGEPMDKAGSYAIQGTFAVNIEKIDGDYNNVVGLPIALINQKLKEIGYTL